MFYKIDFTENDVLKITQSAHLKYILTVIDELEDNRYRVLGASVLGSTNSYEDLIEIFNRYKDAKQYVISNIEEKIINRTYIHDICKKCEGTGKRIFVSNDDYDDDSIEVNCNHCKGNGKLLPYLENVYDRDISLSYIKDEKLKTKCLKKYENIEEFPWHEYDILDEETIFINKEHTSMIFYKTNLSGCSGNINNWIGYTSLSNI